MPGFEYDRRYVTWALGVLHSYLLADELYWHVDIRAPSGEPAYPMLTLEGVLFALHRMRATSGGLVEQHTIEKLSVGLDVASVRWRVAWEKKVQRGFQARMMMWSTYLDEYHEQPEEHADRYQHEVRLRVFLEILGDSLSNDDSVLIDRMKGVDKQLKSILIPSDFIWEEEIKTTFPEERYWYLYGRLPYELPQSAGGQTDTSEG